MMERGLRGKVAALGAAVVLCAGGSLLGSSPQDTAAVVPVPAAGISAVQTRGVKVYVSGAVAKPGLYEIPREQSYCGYRRCRRNDTGS